MEGNLIGLAIAVAVFFLSLRIQYFAQRRVIGATESRRVWASSQDSGIGAVLGISITNALLAAILAVMIFRF